MPAPPAVESLLASPVTGGVGEEADPSEHCAVCGGGVVGPYCHACGERQPQPEDESLGYFLREQFHEVTSADGRMWRSLRALFVPGKLTEEYFAGRRGLYLRPVRLFLIANVVFFFLLTAFGATSVFLGKADVQRGSDLYGSHAETWLAQAASEAGVEQAVYDAAFDQRSGTLSTTLIGLIIPGLALGLGLVLFWTRASAVRHLVFATHYLTFALAGTVAFAVVYIPLSLLAVWGGMIPQDHWMANSIDPFVVVLLVVYLLAAVRRVYGLRWWQAGAASGVLVAALDPLIVPAYQFVLFWATLWTVTVPS